MKQQIMKKNMRSKNGLKPKARKEIPQMFFCLGINQKPKKDQEISIVVLSEGKMQIIGISL